ncbi:MAG TPA: hypothetical protein VMD74_03335 [Candidatus Methylomirabilis sp.]|nr:hypothetical protein [Candidatus Methylomirabilis sp.]
MEKSRSIEELNQSFDEFLAKENGTTANEQSSDAAKAPAPAHRKIHQVSAMDSDEVLNFRNSERQAENTKVREDNFGHLDIFKYQNALESALKSVSAYHKRTISKADDKIFYTEAVEKAVKASQLPAKKKANAEEGIPDGFILHTITDRLERMYENNYKKPGTGEAVNISVYSAVGSALEKDKGVVAIVECQTPDMIQPEKFYILTKGYKRDIRHDTPEAAKLWENYQKMGVNAITVPIPFGGFEGDDLQEAFKGTLPKRICDDAAGKMLKSFKRQEVSI